MRPVRARRAEAAAVKRAKLLDRVRLLAERRSALMIAAKANAVDEYDRRRAEARIEEAAIEYAMVAFRYIGGDR